MCIPEASDACIHGGGGVGRSHEYGPATSVPKQMFCDGEAGSAVVDAHQVELADHLLGHVQILVLDNAPEIAAVFSRIPGTEAAPNCAVSTAGAVSWWSCQ